MGILGRESESTCMGPTLSVRLVDLTWRFCKQEGAVSTCLRGSQNPEAAERWFLFAFYFYFLFFVFSLISGKERNIPQNLLPFENVFCTYYVLGTTQKAPWPKIDESRRDVRSPPRKMCKGEVVCYRNTWRSSPQR